MAAEGMKLVVPNGNLKLTISCQNRKVANINRKMEISAPAGTGLITLEVSAGSPAIFRIVRPAGLIGPTALVLKGPVNKLLFGSCILKLARSMKKVWKRMRKILPSSHPANPGSDDQFQFSRSFLSTTGLRGNFFKKRYDELYCVYSLNPKPIFMLMKNFMLMKKFTRLGFSPLFTSLHSMPFSVTARIQQ
jgi:hypothetical protein